MRELYSITDKGVRGWLLPKNASEKLPERQRKDDRGIDHST